MGTEPETVKASRLVRYFRNWWNLLVICFLIGILIWSFVKTDQPAYTQPTGGSVLSFTPFSDYLTLLGGKHFHEEGLAENYFLANMTIGYPEFARGWYAYQTPLSNVPNASIFYTHYGAYDAMLVGLLFNIGIVELPDIYRVAALLSIIALALWYGAANLLFGRAIAVISLIFMGTSLIFLNFIDSMLSQGVFDIIFIFGATFIFLLAERRQDIPLLWRRVAYGGTWMLFFLLSGNSPEFIPLFAIFFIGYLWAGLNKQVWRRWKTAALLISAPFVAQALHFFQVAAALGGLKYAFIDFTSAITRRTTGFALAEEIEYRDLTIAEAIPKINGDLWSLIRLEFIGLVALLALAWWLTHRLSRVSPAEAKGNLWYQWKLLLVFFAGGISFWFLMIQSTATQSGSAFRTILPFAGLALGYCLMKIIPYMRLRQERISLRVLTLVALLVIAMPPLADRLSGRPFHFEQHQQPINMYYGFYPEEIKMLGTFLQENTAYGDIVITDFPVAETGHPRYPFPGYEYESERRIEAVKDKEQALKALGEFIDIRTSLSPDNPASKVQFYLLADDGTIEEEFGKFAQQVGDLQGILYEDDYWNELYGTVPVPAGSSITFPPRGFYLFKVDIDKLNSYQTAVSNVGSGSLKS